MHIKCKGLFLPLRTTFKQASATRNFGESIWCEISRGGYIGYGEGCPRKYVTQETVASGLEWLAGIEKSVQQNCQSLPRLKNWMHENATLIDQHPAAFCAIETALLDLFAKEKGQSVEGLLGLIAPQKVYTYTAILGDAKPEKFKALLRRYLSIGFTDFKVKLNGNFREDQQKLKALHQFCQEKKVPNYRIRLDANNYWKEDIELAINYLALLKKPFLGIEEPIAPKNFWGLASISTALDLPIILDESLCNLQDLDQLDTHKGQYIANLKVSKMGGILRTIKLIHALQAKNMPIIIGAHVGETSILTRAGMLVAQVAGDSLVAQEGGFGTLLLEKDPIRPSLTIGSTGKINLYQSCPLPSSNGIIPIAKGQWNQGWGLRPVGIQ